MQFGTGEMMYGCPAFLQSGVAFLTVRQDDFAAFLGALDDMGEKKDEVSGWAFGAISHCGVVFKLVALPSSHRRSPDIRSLEEKLPFWV